MGCWRAFNRSVSSWYIRYKQRDRNSTGILWYKKTHWEIAQLIRKLIDQLELDLSPSRLFPEKPFFRFSSQRTQCDCQAHLKVQISRTRIVSTRHIGDFDAQETIIQCPDCKKIYGSEQLQSLIPPQGKFGFNIIVQIGQELFWQCRNDTDIQQALLRENNVSISLSEINNLGKKFIWQAISISAWYGNGYITSRWWGVSRKPWFYLTLSFSFSQSSEEKLVWLGL